MNCLRICSCATPEAVLLYAPVLKVRNTARMRTTGCPRTAARRQIRVRWRRDCYHDGNAARPADAHDA